MSTGRVIAARISTDEVELREVSRFPNEPVLAGGTLHWDILRLYNSVLSGLRAAALSFPLASVGIDSWAVDYGLLDATGALIGNPGTTVTRRTHGVTIPVSPADLYAVTGIQHLAFNTIYQLTAAAGTPTTSARILPLIPDLFAYWLTGSVGAELTNASTTSLLDVSSRKWASGIMRQAGISPALFPPIRQPGDVIGTITAYHRRQLPLVAVGSHDTASAVAAVPSSGPNFAYISCGTWVMGRNGTRRPRQRPGKSRLANFTNEAGARTGPSVTSGTSQACGCCRSACGTGGSSAPPLDDLLAKAAATEPLRFVIDADDPVFMSPGDMPSRITDWLTARGAAAPRTPGEIVRCIMDSLALAHSGRCSPCNRCPASMPTSCTSSRGFPQRAPVPAHLGCDRAARPRRPSGSHSSGQCAGSGACTGRCAGFPGRDETASARKPRGRWPAALQAIWPGSPVVCRGTAGRTGLNWCLTGRPRKDSLHVPAECVKL